MAPHTGSQCRGNCEQHPLVNDVIAVFNDRLSWGWSWGGIEHEFELKELARLSEKERAERAEQRRAADGALVEEVMVGAQVSHIKRYQEKMVARVQKTRQTKVAQPCKWCIGEHRGEECWAYEYTDPKTKKRMTPRTCKWVHPGEEGWCDEWFTDPSYRPIKLSQPVHYLSRSAVPSAGGGKKAVSVSDW